MSLASPTRGLGRRFSMLGIAGSADDFCRAMLGQEVYKFTPAEKSEPVDKSRGPVGQQHGASHLIDWH